MFPALNDTPSSNTEISSTTMAYGVYTGITGGSSRGIRMETAKIVRSCTELVEKLKACRTICEAKPHRIVPGQKAIE